MDDLPDFSRLFATYLENSFELIEDPGKKLYTRDNHCFCPMCSWLVDAPNLRTKKVGPADKRRAQRMKLGAIRRLAHDAGIRATDAMLERAVADEALHEPLSMVTWADDLLHRLNGQVRLDGTAIGAAPLVLWRGFAWAKTAPRKNFKPSVDGIIESEKAVAAAVCAIGQGS